MIDIFADIIKIIVFTACTDTPARGGVAGNSEFFLGIGLALFSLFHLLLCVDSSSPFRHVAVWIDCTQKNRLELIHTGVGKQ